MNHDHDREVALYGLCLTCSSAGRHDDAQRPEPARQLALPEPLPDMDGATYDHEHDHARLGAQARRVLDVMADHHWRTLDEIAAATHDPPASVSARLRDLRKPKFGGYTVERRHRGQPDDGLYEYQLRTASQD